MNHINKRSVMTVLVPLVLATSTAWAVPITVVNNSFEAQPVAPGTYIEAPPTGWLLSGSTSAGVLDGIGFTSPTPDPSDFNNNAWSNGATIYQTLGSVLTANYTYTLMVDVGDRNDVNPDAYPNPTLGVRLGYGSGPSTNYLIPSLSVTPSLINGGWVTWALTFNTNTASAGLGEALRIDLQSSSSQGEFDNVRLDALALPEPGTLGLLALGVLGAGFMRRRLLPAA